MNTETVLTADQESACLAAAHATLETVAADYGRRKRWVARKYRRGREDVVAAVNAEASVRGAKIDPDRLKEIIQFILGLIRALLPLFV